MRTLLGVVAQLGERRVRNAKVGSSILLHSTIFKANSRPGVGFSFCARLTRVSWREPASVSVCALASARVA